MKSAFEEDLKKYANEAEGGVDDAQAAKEPDPAGRPSRDPEDGSFAGGRRGFLRQFRDLLGGAAKDKKTSGQKKAGGSGTGSAGGQAAAQGTNLGLVPRRCRISMLGPSGAGKTVLLSGVHQEFVLTAEHGFSLQLDPKQNFTGYYASMEDVAIYNGEELKSVFPNGTQNSSIYDMELLHGDKVLCGFDFIDYKGGLLREFSNPETLDADATFVKQYIADSDVIFLFLDAVKLSYYEDKGERRYHCYADRLTKIYMDLVKENNRSYHVVVLLSKVDDSTIPKKEKADCYEALVKKADEILQTVKKNSESFLILPVSGVGEGRTTTTMQRMHDGTPMWDCQLIPNKIPEPINIDVAMLYACGLILKQRYEQLLKDKEPLEREIGRSGSRRNKDLEEKIRQLRKASGEIYTLMNQIDRMEEAMCDDWVNYVLNRRTTRRSEER